MSLTVDELRRLADSGAVHTVRVSFSDRLGNWRGKRVPVRQFLASYTGDAASAMGFCDGMLVADVCCDVIQETPFSNYDTGYPDAHLWFTGRPIRPVGWMAGEVFVFGRTRRADHEPELVHPPNVLASVLARAESLGASVEMSGRITGRIMHSSTQGMALDRSADGSAWGVLGKAVDALVRSGVPIASLSSGRDVGSFTVGLAADDAARLAEDLVVTKNAVKEIVAESGATASFMTATPGSRQFSTLELVLNVQGVPLPDPAAAAARLATVRPLLAPSANAYKLTAPALSVRADATTRVVASAEVDPFTAAAVAVAGCLDGADEVPVLSLTGVLALDARRMGELGWVRSWLGESFVDNSIPLIAREADLLAAAVTDFEVDRYWASA